MQDREEILNLVDEAIITNRRNQMRAEVQKAQSGQQVSSLVQNTIDYSQSEIERLKQLRRVIAGNGDEGLPMGNGEHFIALSAQVSSLRATFVEQLDTLRYDVDGLAQQVNLLGENLAANAQASVATATRLTDVIETFMPIVEAVAASQENLATLLRAAQPKLEEKAKK